MGPRTKRVIEECRAYGIPDPTFVDEAGAVTLTFTAEVVADADLERGVSQVRPKSVLSASQVEALEIAGEARALPALMARSRLKNGPRFRDQVVAPLVEAALLVMTVPDKPRSSKQQSLIAEAGRVALANTRKA